MENKEISVTYLKELLYLEVKRLFEIKDRIKNNKWKYEMLYNLIGQLKNSSLEDIYNNRIIICMQLETIFEDNMGYTDNFLNELFKSVNNNDKKELSNFLQKLYNKCINLEAKLGLDLSNNFNMISVYININKKLKFKQFINENELETIFNFLKEKNFETPKIIKLCEKINVYNNSLHKEITSTSEKFAILNMLNIGYESFPTINLSVNKNQIIDNLIDNLFETAKDFHNDFNSLKLQLPMYAPNVYTEEEYTKIYYDFMKRIQKEIYELISLLKDEEFYFNEESKQMVLEEYDTLLNLYTNSKIYFENEISKKIKIIDDDSIESDDIPKTNIFFAMAENGSYLENDLKSVPEEYYGKIIKLLKNKKYGNLNLNDDKQLLNHKKFKQYRELRDDQIRVIYHNIGQNSIVVLGVGVKKSDNDRVLYSRCTSRPISVNLENFDEELTKANETFEQIQNYCLENHRKGTR